MRATKRSPKDLIQTLVDRIGERLDAGCQLTSEEIKFLTDINRADRARESAEAGEAETFSPFDTNALKKLVGKNHGAIGKS